MARSMNKKHFYLILLIGTWAATILAYLWFSRSPYFEVFNAWTRQNLILFYVSLILAKILAIVWPPLPGGLFTLGSIPFIGWFPAYLADVIGGLIGASIAYYLGKKYGYPFLEKVFNPGLVEKIREIKIRKDHEIESVLIGRVAGGGNIMELVCYGAGVLQVRFRSFFIASFIASVASLPAYYLGGNIFNGGNIMIGIAVSAVTLLMFWKLKGRYVE